MTVPKIVLATALAGVLSLCCSALEAKDKVDPADCPCFSDWLTLLAQTDCVDALDTVQSTRRFLPLAYWLGWAVQNDTCFFTYAADGEDTVQSRCGHQTGIFIGPQTGRLRLNCYTQVREDMNISGEQAESCKALLKNMKSVLKDQPKCP